ncbi:helix-turn-helix domain-containing protein [Flavobacterium sp. ANB]|uniref:AraC family transcriptional regulator n=1 Tax=unclassified Flavobacterium TaxID=196869 RepID=UPI0012B899D5|nr:MULTISPECIES: AraC family transcriptional regulator [unclassified Flavobacterium]MBF4519019.1 helix-turn-helix domain-containing protein [Flavobacterium sp. ANB]MTD71621.1 helix-turn-helix domain-containing protein [Flavobacterium sp. LC2016-13]
MEQEITKIPGIVYSSFETQKVIGEHFILEHGLCYIISGSLKVTDAGQTRIFVSGDLVFYRKNFLSKFTKIPNEKESFRSITVVFDREVLMQFSQQYNIVYDKPYALKDPVLKLKTDVLLENFYQTLLPYFNSSLPEQLILLKKQEALMLLLQVNPDLKNVVFDFNQPGKIDLEVFMQQNFKFNVDLKKLAFLTGRSLATFKRDFEKIFQMSPNRWLQKRRLEEAHYLIKEKNKRPSDVYHELGFESISHFSYSFKKLFGVNPSAI